MTKQEQFLWIVQTAIIVNAVRLSAGTGNGADVSDISLTANWAAISDAIRASELIPADMDADAAADDYCTYMLSNERRAEAQAHGHPLPCPEWFARS
ncbi:hypothetical protein D9599_11845 [Roseomonas sp. KE2513]|uniref:hypothetical protein n=1 Tax=Roseomonas sp. KE2513 TaxID=2479202 RepID=UPI0018DF7058|nr:hypothetical protein [Roseomonas sp. KE2513]MBI0536269.1 hypothetical protein [Roseomonas sp. KE2513]